MFFDYVDFKLWNFVSEGPFVYKHFVNNKVRNKPNSICGPFKKRETCNKSFKLSI